MSTKKPGHRGNIRLVPALPSKAGSDRQSLNDAIDATSNSVPEQAPSGKKTTDHALNDIRTNFKELTHIQARLKFLLSELEELI